MSFSKMKTWSNRGSADQDSCINGRTWSRRIQWLEDDHRIKLKLEDGADYKEVIVNSGMAQIIWNRFKSGQDIEDSVSILATPVPKGLASKKAVDEGVIR